MIHKFAKDYSEWGYAICMTCKAMIQDDKKSGMTIRKLHWNGRLQNLKKKNLEQHFVEDWSQVRIVKFCKDVPEQSFLTLATKQLRATKKMIQNNLQIMIRALMNVMMIFDFIVQFILFYCQYLHFRPWFHHVTTMRFKHSILSLHPSKIQAKQ